MVVVVVVVMLDDVDCWVGYMSSGGGGKKLWGRLCNSGGWGWMISRSVGFWLKDKEDSCRW